MVNFFKKKYLIGLLIALTIETLAWGSLVFVVSRRDKSDEQRGKGMQIGKLEWIALLASLTSGLLGWLQGLVCYGAD